MQVPIIGFLTFAMLGGCSPLTHYRQTLHVPAPAPPIATTTTPAGGDTSIGGSLSTWVLGAEDPLPQEGDPGILIAPNEYGGRLRMGLGHGCEIGLLGEFAPSDSAVPSAVGVFPLQTNMARWGAGTFLGYTSEEGPVRFGFVLEATLLQLPYARYELKEGVIPEAYEGDIWVKGDASELYDYMGGGAVSAVRGRGAFMGHFLVKPVEFMVGLAGSNQFTNVGFSNDPEPPAQMAWFAWMPMVGVAGGVPGVRFGVDAWWSTGSFHPTGGLVLGPGFRGMVELTPRALGRADDAKTAPPPPEQPLP